jgi:protein-S-isoprenylcysteine O-methyltransferase Ste14
MGATALEFKLRMPIQVVIVALGFWAPWLNWIAALDFGSRVSTLEWLALEMSRAGLVRFAYATPIVIVIGALAAGLGAVLRVWGAAYLGYTTVHHGTMQAGGVMAAGPYRYLRNPLYLGGWFMMAAMAMLMPPTGALFVMLAVTIFYARLILGEEAFLQAKLGEPYREYLSAVPRIIPRLRSNLAHAPARPQWPVAFLTEINPIGIFFTLAVLAWRYDNLLMVKAVVVSFGLSLVARALAPRERREAEAA